VPDYRAAMEKLQKTPYAAMMEEPELKALATQLRALLSRTSTPC